MASNYTSNYSLCQWAASDKVLRTEFNADNAKIDAAIAAVDGRVDGKVSISALNSLKTTVSGKADQSTVTSLSSTVTSQETALALRNCQAVAGSYKGMGAVGASHPNTLSFSHKPLYLHVASGRDVRSFSAMRGLGFVFTGLSGPTVKQLLTWGTRSVSWYTYIDGMTDPDDQFNDAQTTYYYFAILEL